MKYAAYIQLDAKNSMVKKNKMSEFNICQIQQTSAELAIGWLNTNFGSVAKEIVLFDEFGDCVVVKGDAKERIEQFEREDR
jgi:hypothetical protein